MFQAFVRPKTDTFNNKITSNSEKFKCRNTRTNYNFIYLPTYTYNMYIYNAFFCLDAPIPPFDFIFTFQTDVLSH